MMDLPLPKSTRALFSVAEIGDDDEYKAAELAKPSPSSSSSAAAAAAATLVIVVLAAAMLPFNSAVQAFEFFVFIAKKAAGVVETFWRFPWGLCATTGVALIGGRSGTPAPLMKVLSDLARRMFWWATGPDDDDSGASGGGDNTVFSPDVNETRSSVLVLVVGMTPILVCKLTLRVLLHRACADRGFNITTASMKTLLRLRLCCGGCGVGDGLWLHGRRSERGGTVANDVRAAACCGWRWAAELGVTGDKRLFRTSSHSASLSSSVSAPRSPPQSPSPPFDFLATRPPRLFFLGSDSVGTLLARLLPSLGVLGEEAAIAMRSSRDGRAAGFGGVFSLSEEHGPSEVFFGERSGDRGNRDGETEGDVVPMTKL